MATSSNKHSSTKPPRLLHVYSRCASAPTGALSLCVSFDANGKEIAREYCWDTAVTDQDIVAQIRAWMQLLALINTPTNKDEREREAG